MLAISRAKPRIAIWQFFCEDWDDSEISGKYRAVDPLLPVRFGENGDFFAPDMEGRG